MSSAPPFRCAGSLATVLVAALLGTPAPGAAQGFTNVTASALAGIASAPGRDDRPAGFSGGGAAGDCDGDGLPDLYFTGTGHDVLYRNRGDGTFEDLTVAANLGAALATKGAAFADVDKDGDLDLVVTGLVQTRHYLCINDGRCRFTEEAVARGADASAFATGRSVSFADVDRDGWLDVYVSEWQSDIVLPTFAPPVGRLLRNRGFRRPGTSRT